MRPDWLISVIKPQLANLHCHLLIVFAFIFIDRSVSAVISDVWTRIPVLVSWFSGQVCRGCSCRFRLLWWYDLLIKHNQWFLGPIWSRYISSNYICSKDMQHWGWEFNMIIKLQFICFVYSKWMINNSVGIHRSFNGEII